LWKAAGQARISSADAERAIGSLAADILATAPSQPPLGNAFALAHRCDRSVYDCIYVAPAIDHGHELLTAGERMVNAFGLRYPVRWLGSLVR
jgi:predicted nucleic acid-binding protein